MRHPGARALRVGIYFTGKRVLLFEIALKLPGPSMRLTASSEIQIPLYYSRFLYRLYYIRFIITSLL